MRGLFYMLAIPVAFFAGLMVSHDSATAQAAGGVLKAQIIDLSAMTDAEIGPQIPNVGTIRSKTLVATPNGTIAVQAGNAPKHTHAGSDEIQYVIAGTGTFWLGNELRHVHSGDLIIIPKDTVHAGSKPDNGEFKVIAIKLPPQASGDMHMAP